jgi:NtrC-family two-component system response regulator AlgB
MICSFPRTLILKAIKLLLIGDEPKNRRLIAWGFGGEAYRVKTAGSRVEVEQQVEKESFQAVCIDWKMQQDDATAILDILHRRVPELPIIALVGEKDRKLGANLRELGVSAHLVSPFTIESLHAWLNAHALAQPVAGAKAVAETTAAPASPAVATALKKMAHDESAQRTFELASRAARSTAAILILGETGTGKSLLAQSIHEDSPIREKPFVTVNCPCLNRELLESDLFGHVRGSFTGAVHDTWGKVAAADGGTLFLDEIGDLPMSLQPKLLRLLQEKQYERVGETTPRTANLRIIAATNRDLKREITAGRFREDLYYRLNVIAIDVPSLRNRPTQIMAAAEAFLDTICQQLGKPSPAFSLEARRILETYAWPGNLRELRNVVERAAILSGGSVLHANDFPALVADGPASRYHIGSAISLLALESAHIQMVVANSASLDEAARILGIDKSTLYRKRKQMSSQMAPFVAPIEASASGNAAATGT